LTTTGSSARSARLLEEALVNSLKRLTVTALAAMALGTAAVPAADAATWAAPNTGGGTLQTHTGTAVSQVPNWGPRCRFWRFRYRHPYFCHHRW
jgi:hypothetical protein